MKLSSKTNELFSLLIIAIIAATAAGEEDNDCQDPVEKITYLFSGGSCGETDTVMSQALFSCVDSGNALIATGPYYIEASGSGDSLYFAGDVAIGTEYTLNQEGAFDSLGSATLRVYTTQDGELLQTVTINDMTCSNPLFLFDKFGANQVTQWVETSGRVVTSNNGIYKENTETNVDDGISDVDANISTSSGGVEVMEAGSSAATTNTVTTTIAAAVVVTVASVITLI